MEHREKVIGQGVLTAAQAEKVRVQRPTSFHQRSLSSPHSPVWGRMKCRLPVSCMYLLLPNPFLALPGPRLPAPTQRVLLWELGCTQADSSALHDLPLLSGILQEGEGEGALGRVWLVIMSLHVILPLWRGEERVRCGHALPHHALPPLDAPPHHVPT
ncbi:unnamed protein product, partial [Closterium sp. Naga37s-1]